MRKSEVQIRIAVPDDSEAIAKAIYEAFAPFEHLYTAGAFAATTPKPDEIRKRFDEKGVIWAALKNGEIVGTVSVLQNEGDRLYIRSMAVKPSAQGDGIGGILLETIDKFGAENGFEKFFLYTAPFLAAAIRLYEKNGYARLGEIDPAEFFGTPLLEMEKNQKEK